MVDYGDVKAAALELCRRTGAFHVARRLTRGGLRILAYHTISDRDEHEMLPYLFMRAETFERRMQTLADLGVPVLGLSEALRRLRDGTLPDGATVLTFDDGFRSTLTRIVPVLQRFGFPATVYVTTYYVERPFPIFRLVAQYAAWKTGHPVLRTEALGVPGIGPFDLTDKSRVRDLIEPFILHGQDRMSEPERRDLGYRTCELLGVDGDRIRDSGVMTLMNADEVRELHSLGFDVQAHSHRHLLPEDPEGITRDVGENVDALRRITGSTPVHFCYPCGVWSEAYFGPLRRLGFESASTCQPGLSSAGTEPLALYRFVDGESISHSQFEAEVTGLVELLRIGRELPRRLSASLRLR